MTQTRTWLAICALTLTLTACGGSGTTTDAQTTTATPSSDTASASTSGTATAADTAAPTLTAAFSAVTLEIGKSISLSAQWNEGIASVAVVGTLPTGLTVTPRVVGSTVYVDIQAGAGFSFASGASVAVPVTLTATDLAGNSAQTTLTVTVSDQMPTGAVLPDRWFRTPPQTSGPMESVSNVTGFFDGASWPTANPQYIQNSLQFSSWGIDASAFDPAGRAMTYSIAVVADSSNSTHGGYIDDRLVHQLQINSATGLIVQDCGTEHCYTASPSTPDFPGDILGSSTRFLGKFTVTVTARPVNGSLPLIRTFHIGVNKILV